MISNKSVLSVIETCLNSAISFLISIFLINFTNPEVFGHFNIVFISITLALSIGTALFNNQIAILSAKKKGKERKEVTSTLSISYHILNFTFSLILLLVIDYILDWNFGFSLFFYCFLYNFRENIKTVLYLDGFNADVAISSFTLFVITIVSCLIFKLELLSFSIASFLTFISIAYFISCLVMLKRSIVNFSLKYFKLGHLYDNFNYAKWSLFAGLSSWGQSNAYAYLIAYYHGALFVGYIYATRLVMMPMNVLVTGFYSGIKSQLSEEYEKNRDLVRRQMLTIYSIMSIIVLSYSIFCWYFWSYIDSYFFSSKYKDVAYLIIIWGVYFSMQSVRVGLTNYMQLGLNFKDIGLVSIPLYIISIVCIAISAALFSFYYSIVIMSVFECLMFVLLFLRSRKCL